MSKNRNIALLLLSVFFIPLIFQAYHTISHQFNKHSSSLHYHQECVSNNTSSSTSSQVQGHKEHFKCDICEYQFPFNDLPEVYHVNKVFLKIIDIIKSQTNNKSYQNIFNTDSSRAPPVEIFI